MDTIFTKEPELLHIKLNGSFDLDSFIELLIKIGTEDKNKVIIDATDLQNTDISYDIRYELIVAAKEYLNEKAKYAVVWPPIDINNFIISNLNRFGVTIQIFPKLAKAKKWLLSLS
ncbi:hypothetical protein [Maribacter luteus]|uniref:hypothetical protein n=1 Tax=Maribacter luteus TaxID=2594478 RepID=UPI0024902440|nr:hypothetical protein [Maribacter luteus]